MIKPWKVRPQVRCHIQILIRTTERHQAAREKGTGKTDARGADKWEEKKMAMNTKKCHGAIEARVKYSLGAVQENQWKAEKGGLGNTLFIESDDLKLSGYCIF